MAQLTGNSGRVYTTLPIDAQAGFPQSFPYQTDDGSSYRFALYVDVDADVVSAATHALPLPSTTAFLVVQVERLVSDGKRQTVFLRKVVPELEYLAENIALMFSTQVVAPQNVNGQGDFGSQVVGGIAPRWA